MGEKFSQELKSRLRGGLTRNWHVNVLKDALKEQEALEFGGISNNLRQQYLTLKKEMASLYEDLAFEKGRKRHKEDKITLKG